MDRDNYREITMSFNELVGQAQAELVLRTATAHQRTRTGLLRVAAESYLKHKGQSVPPVAYPVVINPDSHLPPETSVALEHYAKIQGRTFGAVYGEAIRQHLPKIGG
jgi:hypothetical protein